jgi:hypothetical protein
MSTEGKDEARAWAPQEARKLGAVVYLSTQRPLRISDFIGEFHENWPSHSMEKIGKEPHRALFRTGRSDFALELRHAPVPLSITEPAANATLYWPAATAVLAGHVAHLKLSASMGAGVLTVTCDLTRAIASLLAVTDSIAVCWLNGPALNPAKTFVATAREMFSTGLYPLPLWTAVRWDAGEQALVTHGMEQFDAPELKLAQQPDAAPLMVDYLYQIAQSLLVSHHPIHDGGSVDGPHGRLRIGSGRSQQTGKKMLILEPLR